MRPILVGAVLYDPKVAIIWDIIARFFSQHGCPMDSVFYTNYEMQVDALLGGHIDIAWNSPLAWVDAQRRSQGACRAIAMRDTDRDRRTHLVVRRDGPVRGVGNLRGREVAVGALDSPQATLLPLHFLRGQGLREGKDIRVRRHNVLVGKHGDHVGGERDALQSLLAGETDAAAILDLNWDLWSADGTVDPSRVRILGTTPPFDHCNFTITAAASAPRIALWTETLLSMDYAKPAHREMMDLEGLRAWLPGRTTGYADLTAATQESGFFEAARA